MLAFAPSLSKPWARRVLMSSKLQLAQPPLRWQMLIVPEQYDRSPLADEEQEALQQYFTTRADSQKGQALQKQLARFTQPLTDLYVLRYHSLQGQRRTDIHRFMQREVLQRRKIYWEWSAQHWKE